MPPAPRNLDPALPGDVVHCSTQLAVRLAVCRIGLRLFSQWLAFGFVCLCFLEMEIRLLSLV